MKHIAYGRLQLRICYFLHLTFDFVPFNGEFLGPQNICAVSRPAKHDFRKNANQIDFYRKFHIIF